MSEDPFKTQLDELSRKNKTDTPTKQNNTGTSNLIYMIVGFFALTVVIWIILYSIRPQILMVKEPDGTITDKLNSGKLLWVSPLIALILIIIIWLMTGCRI